jgi:hypothetical protein
MRGGSAERQQFQRGGVAVGVGGHPRGVDELVGPLDEHPGVLRWDTEDVDDHADRKRGTDVLDDVDRTLLGRVAQQADRDLPSDLLVALHLVRGECRDSQLPQPDVIGRVGVDDRPTGVHLLLGEVRQVGHAAGIRVRGGVPRDRDEIRISRHGVERTPLVHPHRDRLLAPHTGEDLVRDPVRVGRGVGDVYVLLRGHVCSNHGTRTNRPETCPAWRRSWAT